MRRNRRSRRSIGLIAVAILAISALPIVEPGSAAAAAPGTPNAAAASLPLPPHGWTSAHLEVGLADSPGGAAALHGSGSYKFRYQYLCGGVNTGTGWATWNAGAKFADYYVDESVAAGMTPVFIYYQLLQSSPAGGDEGTADRSNLKNASTMSSYWADFTLLLEHMGAYSSAIVVDIEPDLWGYIQQASTGDGGASVPAAVASSGNSDLAGLPNDATGFAQAFVRLRNKYAPNVLLGYELSMWGTMTDPLSQNIPLSQIDALAARSTVFQRSLGASFDLVFTDPSDRDAAFKQIVYGDGGASWWDATDYQRFDQYVGDFVRGTGLRMVLWQTPLGNTKMRAMNNTWGHYQDNHVEWWFDDATAAHLASTVSSGVVAILFGGGAGGTTAATDAMGDGVTNPSAINGNNLASYSADDDGGYFRHQVNAYYAGGSMSLPQVAGTYVALAPARILDTRDGYWIGLANPFNSHVARTFQVGGRGGVPGNASAVTGNLTVTGQTAAGFLYVGPVAMNDPTSSSLNFPPGDDRANGVTVALGAGGTLSVTYAAPTLGQTAHVIFDVTGYFSPDTGGATYHALTPTRVLDSRDGYWIGLSGAFSSHVGRTFQVSGRGGVPSNATAVTGNLTVTAQSAAGFLYIGPVAMNDPTSSTLNFPIGDDRANGVTVALGGGGALSVTYAAPSLGQTAQVIFDVTGYFTPDVSGARYMALAPTRILDTRTGTGLSGPFVSHVARAFGVAGPSGVPPSASAVTGNLTVTGQTAAGFLFVGPVAMNDPTSSTLNFPTGDDRANAVTVALGSGGTLSITFAAPAPSPSAQVIFDVTGYFVR
jgi:hypothetical protein